MGRGAYWADTVNLVVGMMKLNTMELFPMY